MSVYLDANVLVSFFSDDAFSQRADTYIRCVVDTILVSDFAATEFAAVVSRAVRTRYMTEADARIAFIDFDAFRAQTTRTVEIDPADLRASEAILRRLELPLRAPDTLHIAIALRVGAELVTFDKRMADCARALGLAVAAV